MEVEGEDVLTKPWDVVELDPSQSVFNKICTPENRGGTMQDGSALKTLTRSSMTISSSTTITSGFGDGKCFADEPPWAGTAGAALVHLMAKMEELLRQRLDGGGGWEGEQTLLGRHQLPVE